MKNDSRELKPIDVDWLAFQYLTGEMPEDGMLGFEARLASDQPAREALARVVALTQAVSLVEATTCEAVAPAGSLLASPELASPELASPELASPELASPELASPELASPELARSERRNSAWMAPPAWLAIAALACVAGLLLWKPLTSSPHVGPVNQPLTLNHPALEDVGALAVLWVGTAEFLAATELVGSDEPETALFDDELLESFVEPTVASEADLDRLRAPSWMMAALADPSAVEGQE